MFYDVHVTFKVLRNNVAFFKESKLQNLVYNSLLVMPHLLKIYLKF